MSDHTKKSRPDLTIVGGQPGRRGTRGKMRVPVGIEKLLFLGAQDEGFKSKLLGDRHVAIAECGIRLRPSEEAMLNAISNTALETMIGKIIPENPRRRKFMGLVAAAAASLAAGTAGTGCNDDAETDAPDVWAGGIDPGTDTDTDTDSDSDSGADTDPDDGMDAGLDSGTRSANARKDKN